MKIDLDPVTIWSASWTGEPDRISRTIRVLEYCQRIISCSRIVCLSPVKFSSSVEHVFIPPITSVQLWNAFISYQVPVLLGGEYLMSVHEDGFPIRPDLWRKEFLEYDYIGAPWPDGVVGNGGFNIESRKLLNWKLRIPTRGIDNYPSDDWVCKVHRKGLETLGIRFAPKEVAMSFSTEFLGRENPSFGFHGKHCCLDKYIQGWQIIERSESD